jgi:hypothetical protein
MAPGLRRPILYTLLACALIALALLPPRIRPEPDVGWVPRTDMRAARQLEMAGWSLRQLELRDSILAVIGARPVFSEDSIAFLFPSGFPTLATGVVRGLLVPRWTAVVDGAPRARLLVAFTIDSVARPQESGRSLPYTETSKILPEITDGHTCISTIVVGVRDARLMNSTGTLALDLLAHLRRWGIGACAYFGAFGIPGDGIRTWLDARQNNPVIEAGWTDDPLADSPEPTRWSGMLWWNPEFIDLAGCAAGEMDRCQGILWGQRDADRDRRQFARFAVRGVLRFSYESGSYLADMVAHYGRERFARFWTSDAPLEQAFADAMGEPIERWTMKWARAHVGIPDVGARTRAVPALLVVLASVVVVGAAGALSRLRQVA